MDNYTIYIINKNASGKDFWCFLDTPKIDTGNTVFANSSAELYVESNSKDDNTFTIPVQFSLGADASNRAVGLDVKVDSRIKQDVDLNQVWDATYATVPPKEGPKLTLNSATGGGNKSIQVNTNAYDEVVNDHQKWYESMSFGINTAQGFMGVTWQPSPSEVTTITPKMSFYISTGEFSSNKLADLKTVSKDSAHPTSDSFSSALEAWVTLDSKGQWHVSSTPPEVQLDLATLLESQLKLASAHAELVSLIAETAGDTQEDMVKSVQWAAATGATGTVNGTYRASGTLVLASAVVAMTTFMCGGIKFKANGTTDSGTTWKFSYDGSYPLHTVKSVLKQYAKIRYSNNKEEQANLLQYV